MATRAQVVEEARSWIGTRYQHQAKLKGVAIDCGGLICGVGVALGLIPADYLSQPRVQAFAGYGKRNYGERMIEACALLLDPLEIEEARIGDVYLMAFDSGPQHSGIVSEWHGRPGLIHAYAQARKVAEHPIDVAWRKRIVGAYTYRGVE